jgi:hypothetical protein
MAQDAQRLKSEIVSALDFLSPDSLRLLVKFVSFLRTNAAQPEINQINDVIAINAPRQTVHMTSPRLVHRDQSADFKKEIVEIEFNDGL